jgi:hypothetical protein
VRMHDTEQLQVHMLWWRDDYDTQIRQMRVDSLPLTRLEAVRITAVLVETLDSIVSWQELTESYGGNANWSQMSREYFEEQGSAGLSYPRV